MRSSRVFLSTTVAVFSMRGILVLGQDLVPVEINNPLSDSAILDVLTEGGEAELSDSAILDVLTEGGEAEEVEETETEDQNSVESDEDDEFSFDYDDDYQSLQDRSDEVNDADTRGLYIGRPNVVVRRPNVYVAPRPVVRPYPYRPVPRYGFGGYGRRFYRRALSSKKTGKGGFTYSKGDPFVLSKSSTPYVAQKTPFVTQKAAYVPLKSSNYNSKVTKTSPVVNKTKKSKSKKAKVKAVGSEVFAASKAPVSSSKGYISAAPVAVPVAASKELSSKASSVAYKSKKLNKSKKVKASRAVTSSKAPKTVLSESTRFLKSKKFRQSYYSKGNPLVASKTTAYVAQKTPFVSSKSQLPTKLKMTPALPKSKKNKGSSLPSNSAASKTRVPSKSKYAVSKAVSGPSHR